jgi:hypothetical protein
MRIKASSVTSASFGRLDQKGWNAVPGQDNGLTDGSQGEMLRMMEDGVSKHVCPSGVG